MLAFSFVVLTGCQTAHFPTNSEVSTPPSGKGGPALSGRTMGGQQPVIGAAIQLYAVGITGDGSAANPLISTGSMTVGSSNNYSPSGASGCIYTTGNTNNCSALPVTNSQGVFSITSDWSCTSNTATYGPNPLLYIVATGGNPGAGTNANLSLMTALGACSSVTASTFIQVNEVTTVGAAAALYPWMTSYSAIGANASGTNGASAAATAGINTCDVVAVSVSSQGTGYTAATEQAQERRVTYRRLPTM